MKYGRHVRGFTLIELMIAIAIVGILAAIAVPTYLTYTKKAKFSEVIMATGPFRSAVDICAQSTNALTACGNAQNGVPSAQGASGQVASIVTAANGTVTATDVNAATYILVPTRNATTGQVTWSIDTAGSTCVAAGLC